MAVGTKDVIITVTGPPIQYEGVRTVLTNVQELAGVNHIFLEPKCFIDTGDKQDIRIPPLDLDGSDRVLERPLSGKRELYGKLVFPFEIDEDFYQGTPYRPVYQRFETDIIGDAMQLARDRGIKVSIMLSLLKTPNLNEEDYLVMPSGESCLPTISNKGCVNNPRIAQFGLGFLLDVVTRYRPDGVFVDWLEFTNYRFEDNLLCFCSHCEKKAEELGFDFEGMRRAAISVLEWVENATEADLKPAGGWDSAWQRMSPNISELFRFKALSVQDYVKTLRRELDRNGFDDIGLYISGFAPPMNTGTGMDYRLITNLSHQISSVVKLYRFHWGLMVGWYAMQLARLNKRIMADAWVPFLLDMFELEEDCVYGVEHYTMPRPHEVGPLRLENEEHKLRNVLKSAQKQRVIPLVHAYCPREVFYHRLVVALNSDARGMGIQRYGYASDEKLSDIAKAISQTDTL